MKTAVRHAGANFNKCRNAGADYNWAGKRYGSYADDNLNKLFDFDGQYGFSDREIWGVIGQILHELRVNGTGELSVLDLGCGPGTWLRRIVDRARIMGFTKITARGIDLAETQICRARFLTRNLSSGCEVKLCFEVADVRAQLPEADKSVDLCLCLYSVLNHLPAEDLPALFQEVARVTKGSFLATARAISSIPTIYVDNVTAAKACHQDNSRGRLDVQFQDGRQTSFTSHLFGAAEIREIAEPALVIDDLRGLDLFHGRFARDPQWNPEEAEPSSGFLHALRDLESRYSRDPSFIDHATHVLMVAHARPKKGVGGT